MKKILAHFYALSCGNQNFTEEIEEKSISLQVTGNNLSSSTSTVKLQGSHDRQNFFDLKDSSGNVLQASISNAVGNSVAVINACTPYKYLRACLTVGDSTGSINIDVYTKPGC